MGKLADRLPHLYKELHDRIAFRGNSWVNHYKKFSKFVQGTPGKILDYGCGPSGGLSVNMGDRVIAYDPYLPKFSASPWKQEFSTFFSCDVFEHLTKDGICYLFKTLARRKAVEKMFVVVATRSANKSFSNGLNVHLIVESSQWWKGLFEAKLGDDFGLVHAFDDMLLGETVFAAVRRF